MVKNCDLGLENAALGLRPRAAFSRPRSQFFTIRTSQPANNIFTRKIFSYWLFLKEKFRLSAQRNQNEPQSIKSVCYKYCLVSVLTCFRVNIKNGSGNISIYRGTVPHHGEPTSANIKLSLNVATWRNIKQIWCRPTTRFVFIARLVIVTSPVGEI